MTFNWWLNVNISLLPSMSNRPEQDTYLYLKYAKYSFILAD